MIIRAVPETTAKRKTTAAAVDPSIQAGQAGPSESQAGRFTRPLCSPIWNLPSLLCHDAATACGWVLRSGPPALPTAGFVGGGSASSRTEPSARDRGSQPSHVLAGDRQSGWSPHVTCTDLRVA